MSKHIKQKHKEDFLGSLDIDILRVKAEIGIQGRLNLEIDIDDYNSYTTINLHEAIELRDFLNKVIDTNKRDYYDK